MTTTKTTLPLYLAATATSLFGNSAIAIVLPWLVLERTGDPAMAGLVAAVSAVPGAIAAFVGGHLIDKVGRRRMSVLSDAGSAVAVAGLAIVDAADDMNRFRALSQERAEIEQECEEDLPQAVTDIYRFWIAKRGHAPIRHDEPRIGRNDACPCGSGKKFKQCCGSPEKLN